jgi:4'-phosphopantetheinyl transferase
MVRQSFPANPILSADAVHVVRFELDAAADPRGAMAMLDARERARAARLRDEHHRRLFVSAHAAARTVLGRCLGTSPAAVRFSYGRWGKPEIADAATAVRFNLTHSHDRGMLAVGVGRAVGIDLEKERLLDALRIARHFFSPAEQAALAAMPPEQHLAAFHRCWVRKESFVKANGDGLMRSLAAFDMSMEETGGSLLLACRDVPGDVQRWMTVALPAEPGYAAALTVEGHGWRLVEWDAV